MKKMMKGMKHGTAHDVAPAGMVDTAMTANLSEAYAGTRKAPRRQGRGQSRKQGRRGRRK